MRFLRRLFTRIFNTATGRTHDERLKEEIEEHIALQTAENIRAGFSPVEARRRAILKFGGVEGIREDYRAERRFRWIDDLLQDMRFGLRVLLRSPGFSFVAILTLALGIGSNTVTFSLVEAVLLRPLPYKDPGRLLALRRKNINKGIDSYGVSPAVYAEWRERTHSFDDLAAVRGVGGTAILTGTSLTPQSITVAAASSNFFSMLGVQPILGRGFLPEEEKQFSHAFGGSVCILSHALWQRSFGSDPGVLNRAINLNGRNSTIVGVMPADFEFVAHHDVWVPLPAASVMGVGESPYVPVLQIYGHLQPGVQLAQAQAEMDLITAYQAKADPQRNSGWGALVAPLHEYYVNRNQGRASLWLIFGIVGLVLLIGCANIVNLVLARGAGRRKEFGIRLALGAGRGRVVLQSLVESLIISMTGGAAGLLLASCAMPLIKTMLPVMPSFQADAVKLDLRVFIFTFGVSVAAGVLSGLMPALRNARTDLNESLKTGRCSGLDRAGSKAGSLLVVCEFAVALMVVIGAGLALRTLLSLGRIDSGIDSDHLLTMGLYCPLTRYPSESDISAFQKKVDERLRSLPGVEATAFTIGAPLTGWSLATGFVPEGEHPAPGGVNSTSVVITTATPDYFRALGVGLIAGRYFNEHDMNDDAPRVVVVSQRLAHLYWPQADAIGKGVRLGDDPAAPLETIVGIVADVHHSSLAEPADLEVYQPVYRGPYWEPRTLLVRVAGNPQSLSRAVEDEVTGLDPDQPANQPQPMNQALSASLSRQRFSAVLLGAFAGIALVLAAVGIYGVMSHLVAQRTNEIGIRMALGAQRHDVLKLVIGQGIRPALAGVVLGLMGALGLTRLMKALLFGVTPTDAITFISVSCLLVIVALAACLVPARRAAKVDPLVAVRHE